jgi:hypothetical protein
MHSPQSIETFPSRWQRIWTENEKAKYTEFVSDSRKLLHVFVVWLTSTLVSEKVKGHDSFPRESPFRSIDGYSYQGC